MVGEDECALDRLVVGEFERDEQVADGEGPAVEILILWRGEVGTAAAGELNGGSALLAVQADIDQLGEAIQALGRHVGVEVAQADDAQRFGHERGAGGGADEEESEEPCGLIFG